MPPDDFLVLREFPSVAHMRADPTLYFNGAQRPSWLHEAALVIDNHEDETPMEDASRRLVDFSLVEHPGVTIRIHSGWFNVFGYVTLAHCGHLNWNSNGGERSYLRWQPTNKPERMQQVARILKAADKGLSAHCQGGTSDLTVTNWTLVKGNSTLADVRHFIEEMSLIAAVRFATAPESEGFRNNVRQLVANARTEAALYEDRHRPARIVA